MSMYERTAGVPFVLRNEFRICIDRPGSVEITSVDFEHSAGGLSVDDFAVQDIEEYSGLDESDGYHLADHGFELGEARVEVVCSSDEDDPDTDIPHAVLGIEVSKPTDDTATGTNMVIRYRTANGQEDELVWDFDLVLCGTDNSNGECDQAAR
jgi:hypothetical protein